MDFPKPIYSRVILPLKALLEGEFFNEYIKKGIADYPYWSWKYV